MRQKLYFTLAVILSGPFLFNPLVFSQSEKNKAVIKKVRNEVELKHEDVIWQRARVEQEIYPVTSIRTGSDSRAEVLFPDGTITRIGSKAFFTFLKKRNRAVKVHAGKVSFNVIKNSGGLEFYTPDAVAVITGTEGFIDFSTNQTIIDNTYIIKKGDTIDKIARRILGKNTDKKKYDEIVKQLIDLNKNRVIKNNYLYEGETLILNTKSEKSSLNNSPENYFALGLIEGSSDVYKSDSNGNPQGNAQKVKEGELLILKDGKFRVEDLYENLKIPENMVVIRGGSFLMGGDGESDEKPLHEVIIRSYYLGKHEVTQSEYKSVMGENPSDFHGDDLPVEQVSWWDAIKYCNKKSIKENLAPAYDEKSGALLDSEGNITSDITQVTGYRLPTEAEWEYAARGAKDSNSYSYSGSNDLDSVAWYGYKKSGFSTHPVGSKKANEAGAFDMSGNVQEWVYDTYLSDAYLKKKNNMNPYFNDKSPDAFRIYRGGAWDQIERYQKVYTRSGYKPDYKYKNLGFRIARNVSF